MITLRKAKDIYQAKGEIENGTFGGRWHFSFDQYHDSRYMSFGNLRVFNDDTLSPGAVWPLHPHRDIEVVTYCVSGEFRHADEFGKGGILKPGWVQHTTVGRGLSHSEINNLPDQPLRFIQMWFLPNKTGFFPSVEQKKIEKIQRTNTLAPLVSDENKNSLEILAEAKVFSCFLEKGNKIRTRLKKNHGGYLYVLEGGPLHLNRQVLYNLDAAQIEQESKLLIEAKEETEFLFVVVAVD